MFTGIPLNYSEAMTNGFAFDDDVLEYSEYIVKKGETLNKIARKFDIDISQLIEDNGIINKNNIYAGQRLKIRNNADKNNATYEHSYSNLIFLDVRNADIRDVVSAIAYYLDTHAIFLEEPVRVNFEVRGVEPYKALELLLQSLGLNYIKDDNLLIIGRAEQLQKNFFNRMMLTRFDLKYIPAIDIENQIKKLGIPIQSITINENPLTIWVQGTPTSLAKVKELIIVLDRKENAASSLSLTEIKLNYITSRQLVEALSSIDALSQIVTLDTNPKAIWVKASNKQLLEIKQIIAALDKRENAASSSRLTSLKLNNITTEKLAPVFEQLDLPVQIITIPGIMNTLWLQGTQADVDNASSIISALDVAEVSSDESTMFLFKLRNITAQNAAERLELFGFDDVKTVTFSYPDLGQDILVLSPKEEKNKVIAALEGLDLRGLGDNASTMMIPVDSATGPYAYNILEARRELLIRLMDELEDDRSIIDVSDNLWTESGEEYRVLLIRSTPEVIRKVREMINLIDSP